MSPPLPPEPPAEDLDYMNRPGVVDGVLRHQAAVDPTIELDVNEEFCIEIGVFAGHEPSGFGDQARIWSSNLHHQCSVCLNGFLPIFSSFLSALEGELSGMASNRFRSATISSIESVEEFLASRSANAGMCAATSC